MTQQSAPQTGHVSDGLTPDAGPYSAPRWAGIWSKFLTSGPTQGPIGHKGDATLEVKNPSGQTFTIESGDALVAGRMLESDAIMTFAVAPPGSNSRIDVVVAVQNESNVPIDQGIASTNDLLFPTVLTDYEGLSSIPPYTSRLAILEGTPSATPVAPTLDQNPALLHMIPLGSYEMDSGGTVTDLTDLRVYAFAAAGGAVYTSEFHINTTQEGYSGRVKLVPFTLKFHFDASNLFATIDWQGEPDPLLATDLYATFVSTTVNDFDLITDWGESYRMFVSIVSSAPDFLRFRCVRGGYVDNSGVAQPPSVTATDVYAEVLFVQLLDRVPITDPEYT